MQSTKRQNKILHSVTNLVSLAVALILLATQQTGYNINQNCSLKSTQQYPYLYLAYALF